MTHSSKVRGGPGLLLIGVRCLESQGSSWSCSRLQLTHVLMQEQYTFLYEVVLEGLLCGSTGVPVESIASHIRCLREAESSRHNVLEKEFKVPPGSDALGPVCDASHQPQLWDGAFLWDV